ncbi:MAG TPA: hypothetical protein VNY29_15585 [Terriglobales bacterium]|jgi:hypothetical protein|nr:hypothetical protein [Terriglobales bacterium]
MAERLEEVMSHAYTDLEERQRLEAGTSLLKTYLLEAHSGDAGHGDILRILTAAFSPEMLGQRSRATVHETQEEFFYRIAAQWATNTAEFFVDASDRRFWILHSASNSKKADNILHRVIANDTHLDSAWLPIQLLERVADMGIFKGLFLDYDHREVPDVEFDEPDAPVEYLKMQLWGNRARQVLGILRQPNAFPNATTLSKVKIKHYLDRTVDENSFSLDEVKWDGKITARGTSFQSHINLVNSIYRSYSEKVRGFEERFSLRFEEPPANQPGHGRVIMDGEPLSLTFSRPIADIQKFMAAVFGGTDPFRLWGVPVSIGTDYYRVTALDLHVTNRITFEIAPGFMRVYLPHGSCGNTIVRLFTNLQHYYDSQVVLAAGGDETLF